MPRLLDRRVLAVLTVALLTSFFAISRAQGLPESPFSDNPAWTLADGVLTSDAATVQKGLTTRAHLADSVTSFEYRAATGAHATLYLQGRYAVELPGAGDWRAVSIRFRAPRFDEGYKKYQNALLIEFKAGEQVQRNLLFDKPSPGGRWDNEDMRGPSIFVIDSGSYAVRNARHDAADFAQLQPPAVSGGATNEKELTDYVALGKETFDSIGCAACHLAEPPSAAVSTGPNLYGLFRPEARTREVAEGSEGRRFQVKVGREYLYRSVRTPAEQLAVAESGPQQGTPYLPVMPAFTREMLSDEKIDAIGAYLATLNPPAARGPMAKLGALKPSAPYDPMADGLQFLVNDTVRLQRGPLPGTSGRAIHVGNPNGVNYSFDPRLLAVVKIWQGGFLDMTGELTNRGGKGLAPGYESREIGFGGREYLLAPLNAAGQAIDFTFKDAKFGDMEAIRASLYSPQDQLARIAAVDAQFLGYSRDSRDKSAAPVFRYRVAKNTIGVSTAIQASGDVLITLQGTLAAPQSFALNDELLKGAAVSAGKLENARWNLPAGKLNATLRGRIALSDRPWRPAPSNYSYQRAPLEKVAGHGAAAGRLQHRELLSTQGQLRPAAAVRSPGPGIGQRRHGGGRHAHRRHLAPGQRRVAAVRRRSVRQPRRGGRRRQGAHRGRRPEGRADAHPGHQRRRHRRRLPDAVRRQLVPRQLSQLHARPGARRRRRVLHQHQSGARHQRHGVHRRRQRHGELGRILRLVGARRARWQVPVVRQRHAQPRQHGSRSRWPALVHGQPGRLRRHLQALPAQEGRVLRTSRRVGGPSGHDARIARDPLGELDAAQGTAGGAVPAQPRGEFPGQSGLGHHARQVRALRRADC